MMRMLHVDFRLIPFCLALALLLPGARAQATGRLVPDDPSFADQWALDQVSDADVNGPEAWDQETGADHVVIAILDTGIDFDAEALVGRVLNGHNVLNTSLPPEDVNGRGTQLAALAAGAGNDGKGIAGLCWNCRILPVKVSQDDGLTYTYQVVNGVIWAADNGADLILVGQAHPANSALFREVMNARKKGVLTFGPMGDSASTGAYYPACYSFAVGVGATDLNDHWAGAYTDDPSRGSNHNNHIDLVAPGDWVLASGIDDAEDRVYSTRFATAYVVGAAGLALSAHRSLGLDELRHYLRAAAHDQVGDPAEDLPGFDQYHGYGRLDASRTVEAARAALTLTVEHDAGTTTVRLGEQPAIANGYDFVRGNIASLSLDADSQESRLGDLVCIANDSDLSEVSGYNVDDNPLPGSGFFYLARYATPVGDRSYGGSSLRYDRRNWVGDCSYAPVTD